MNELIKQVEQWSADKGLNKSDSTKRAFCLKEVSEKWLKN